MTTIQNNYLVNNYELNLYNNAPHIPFGEIQAICNYVRNQENVWTHQDFFEKESRYIKPFVSKISRPVEFTNRCQQIFVHLTRSKLGDPLLGFGYDKVVKFAVELRTGQLFASEGEKFMLSSVGNEINFLNRLKGVPKILQIFSSTHYMGRVRDAKGTPVLYIKRRVTVEFCRGPDLFDLVQKRTISLREKKSIFEDLIMAVSYLHRMQLIHGDIKPENVFLQPDDQRGFRVVLGDLGYMADLRNPPRKKEYQGTVILWSPEYAAQARAAIQKTAGNFPISGTPDSFGRDAWALGHTLLWLTDGAVVPWMNMKHDRDRLIDHLLNLNSNWMREPSNRYSPQHLAWEMLEVDPTRRLLPEFAAWRLSSLQWS